MSLNLQMTRKSSTSDDLERSLRTFFTLIVRYCG